LQFLIKIGLLYATIIQIAVLLRDARGVWVLSRREARHAILGSLVDNSLAISLFNELELVLSRTLHPISIRVSPLVVLVVVQMHACVILGVLVFYALVRLELLHIWISVGHICIRTVREHVFLGSARAGRLISLFVEHCILINDVSFNHLKCLQASKILSLLANVNGPHFILVSDTE
jgi:hypothetical protein